jgi:hypothetical protein
MLTNLFNKFVCWWSHYYNDIHQPSDDVRGVPDHFEEYTCQRCGATFKDR